jgi:coproporphyrinogen III oxidase-like Fe-S oxidoreductase
VQPFAQVEHAVALFKDAGLTHIYFDLMCGLPHQGKEQLAAINELATNL